VIKRKKKPNQQKLLIKKEDTSSRLKILVSADRTLSSENIQVR